MRITTLFRRVILVATGSGIGPMLGNIEHPSTTYRLVWSAPSPHKTFGTVLVNTIKRHDPHAVIHDTRTLGQPNMVQLSYNVAKDFRAEAVIIIAKENITKKVIYGLETRGMPAFGAIWDG
jgi:hypothetical protein